jgi:hypothetical protein
MDERNGEERIVAALRPFGWVCGPEFWRRYYSDPWIFNLVNAVERLAVLKTEPPEAQQ